MGESEILVGDKPLKSYVMAALLHEGAIIRARGRHIKKAIDAALILERAWGYAIEDVKLSSESVSIPDVGEKYVSSVDIVVRRDERWQRT